MKDWKPWYEQRPPKRYDKKIGYRERQRLSRRARQIKKKVAVKKLMETK